MTMPLEYNWWDQNVFNIPGLPQMPYAPVYNVQAPTVPVAIQNNTGMLSPIFNSDLGGGDGAAAGPDPNDNTSSLGIGFGNPSIGSNIGSLAGTGIGLATGLTGLGTLGSIAGTGLDVANQNSLLSEMGVPSNVSLLSALADNMTFGAFGQDVQAQALDDVEAAHAQQAANEATIGLGAFGGTGTGIGSDDDPSVDAQGQATGLDDDVEPSDDVSSSDDGETVICTELHRQGLISDAVFAADALEGKRISQEDPFVLVGYHLWGVPVARLMRKSKIFTKLVLFLAEPWARQMAGEKSIRGSVYVSVGVPLCRMVGKYVAKSNARESERDLGQGIRVAGSSD